MTKLKRTLNKFQKLACKVYGDGDFSYFADEEDPWPLIEDCGDTLFVFVMRELSDDGEDAMDAECAIQRMDMAARDIRGVQDAIERFEDEEEAA